MEVNIAALMRPNSNTIKVELLTRIPTSEAVGSLVTAVTTPKAVPDIPPAPSVGNTPARASSAKGPVPIATERPGVELWTFINTLPDVQVGDHVIVDTKFGLSFGRVHVVDDGLDLQPGDTVRYQYVVSKLDFGPYATLLNDNTALETVFRDSYQQRVRETFRETMMAGLPDSARSQIQALLK